MVQLAQLDYSLPFLGSFVLKGRTAAAVPCEKYLFTSMHGTRCIQWHLVQTRDVNMKNAVEIKQPEHDNELRNAERVADDDSSLSMEMVLEQIGSLNVYADTESFGGPCPDADADADADVDVNVDVAKTPKSSSAPNSEPAPSFQKPVEAVISENHRHFLGVYEHARLQLGTRESDTTGLKSADHAKDLKSLSRRVAWSRSVSTGASYSILGVGGISFSTTWQISRATQREIERSDPLVAKVTRACRRVATLYNPQWKTGWLVPEISIILHLMKVRSAQPDFRGVPFTFPSDEETTAERRERTVIDFLTRDDNSDTNKQWFESFANLFQQMKQSIIDSLGKPRRFHSSTHDSLLSGVDFHEVAVRSTFELKQVAVNTTNSGKWPSMIKGNFDEDQEDDNLVSFCRDSRDYIVPSIQGTCKTWAPIPQQLSCLVILGSVFQELTRRNGTDASKLSRRLYFESSSDPPFVCPGRGCDRLQKLNEVEPTGEERRRRTDQARLWPGDQALVFGGTFCPRASCN